MLNGEYIVRTKRVNVQFVDTLLKEISDFTIRFKAYNKQAKIKLDIDEYMIVEEWLREGDGDYE